MKTFEELIAERKDYLDAPHYKAQCEVIATVLLTALKEGNKLLWFANGGAASTCEHLSGEFTGRFLAKRHGYPSIALSANSADVTAIGNDFGFANIYARQIEAFAQIGDIAIGMTTSGNSPNVVEGLKMAQQRNIKTVVFTGNGGGAVMPYANYIVMGPNGTSGPIQEVHMALGHIIAHMVDERLAS